MSLKTKQNYLLHTRLFQEHFDKTADEMGHKDIQVFLHHLRMERGYKKSSVSTVNGALDAHADICEDYGDVRVSYLSCRNRHCPSIWKQKQA